MVVAPTRLLARRSGNWAFCYELRSVSPRAKRCGAHILVTPISLAPARVKRNVEARDHVKLARQDQHRLRIAGDTFEQGRGRKYAPAASPMLPRKQDDKDAERRPLRSYSTNKKIWSGRRGSNPRPRPWQGRAPASTPCRTALLLSIKRSRGSERCNTICNTNRKSDRAKNATSTRFYWLSCGRRIVVIQQLPKLHTRPSSKITIILIPRRTRTNRP